MGGVHGIYQVLGDISESFKRKLYPWLGIRLDSISYCLGQIATTFILIMFAWIFFRAQSMSDAIGIIKHIFTRWNPWAITDKTLYNIGLSNYEWNILIVALLVLFMVDLVRKIKRERLDIFLNLQGALVKGIVISFLLLMIGIFGYYGEGYDAKQFIYFQF